MDIIYVNYGFRLYFSLYKIIIKDILNMVCVKDGLGNRWFYVIINFCIFNSYLIIEENVRFLEKFSKVFKVIYDDIYNIF